MKKLIKIIAWALLILTLGLIVITPKKYEVKWDTNSGYKAVLTIWQIDSFEGGKGSRASFLKNVSSGFTKKYKGLLTLVSSHTVKSANKMLNEGKVPDIISIGVSGLDFSSYQKEVGNLSIEGGGTINDKRYFVPWAKSGYFKITKGGGEKVIVSEGEYNSSLIALALSKESFNSYKLLNNKDAFNEFLISSNVTLIGTLRDVIRIESRNIDCKIEPLGDFSDLYQYALITSKNNANYSRLFIDYLLSKEVQSKLTGLSMLSVNTKGLYPDNLYLSALEKIKINYTVSPFLDANTILKLKDIAKDVLNNVKEREELIKYL